MNPLHSMQGFVWGMEPHLSSAPVAWGVIKEHPFAPQLFSELELGWLWKHCRKDGKDVKGLL